MKRKKSSLQAFCQAFCQAFRRLLPGILRGILLGAVLICPGLIAGCSGDSPDSQGEDSPQLTVLTYDSFVSEWGPGPRVEKIFEEKTGIDLEMISYGDAGQLLARVIREKDRPRGDVVLGLDNNQEPDAMEAELFLRDREFRNRDLSALLDQNHVPVSRRFDANSGLLPYDYGYFAVIYDSHAVDAPPQSMEDLTRPRFRNSLIVMDPRTSTPGLGFMYWTISLYGDRWKDYWERLQPSLLTITDGWDSGYGLFTSGEAPLVLSYTTSPAYHKEYEDTDRYQAAVFPGGHYRQLEGMGILRSTPHRREALRFVQTMLDLEVQEILPLTNWMYPVREDAELPDSYRIAPEPGKTLELSPRSIRKHHNRWLEEWTRQAIQ